jgi:precorrin-3B synthase
MHEQTTPATMVVGAQPRLGRLDADALRALSRLAPRLRMTPWQGVMLLDVPSGQAASVQASIAALGLATHVDEPFAHLIACAGSQGCAKGLADTKSDALQLAGLMPLQADVHLSGCARSCAASRPVDTTLLAVAPGRYDLYQRRADDPRAEGFGTLLAHHLTIQQAAQWLARSTIDA